MKNIFLFDCYSDPAEELNGDHRPAGGLRGWKYLPCLDGTRVPFIVRWPGSRPSGATTDPFMPRDIRLPLGPRFLLPGVLPDASNLVPDPATSATHLRGRKTILICGAVFAALLSGAWAQAAELPVPAIGVKDQLVFSDDFERTGLGAALKSPIPAFTVADGLLKGRQERADHGGTLAAVLPLPDGNTIIEIKFRFAGARSFNLACDDISYRGTHAGHISRVTIRPNRITLYDDKEGVMRNDIYALRRSDDPQKKAEGDRLAEKATAHFPVKLEQDRWYSFGLEIVGDRMQVSIDGRLVGHLQSPGLVHATKPNLRLSTWGSAPAQEVHFDELRVWSVKTTAESNEPRCPPLFPMKPKDTSCLAALLIWSALVVALPAQPAPSAPVHWKPNKILLVVGSQWADPNGDIIDGRLAHPHHPPGDKLTGPVSGDTFWRTAAFLKTCSIPFDILRLDQMELRLNYFLDHHLQPAYGAVIWDVDADAIPARDLAVVKQVVTEHGISLIVLSDRQQPPVIQELLGLQWSASPGVADPAPYRVAGGHYITRGLGGEHAPLRVSGDRPRPAVTAQGATVLATEGGQPVLTVREVTDRASAIWLGGDPAHMLEARPFLLRALRRAVVHGIGYSVYRTFPHTVVFRMDDPTCTAMFGNWHFPALTEQEIVDWIVKPLQERNAVLQLNMVPGRFMDPTRRVEPNWTQDYTDEIGERHDLVSNGRGWRRGLDAGVFEVQSHGWTHRNPQWEKYWAAGPTKRLDNRWGGEFYDRLGYAEVPNAMQLFSLQRSRAVLEEIWGQRPLYFVPGQNAESFSYANHTARLARKAGFAITQDFWLGRDYIINVQPYFFTDKNVKTSNVPGLEGERPILILSHDIEVYRDHDFMRKRLAEFGPEYRFTGVNELIAYLFAEVRGGPAGRIEFAYDPENCRHFATHGSSWELHLSDHFRNELNRRGPAGIAIDGKPAAPPAADFFKEQMEISLPAGTGPHIWEVRP